VHGVDPRERAGLVRERRDARDVLHGPDGVRRPRESDHPRPIRQPAAEIVQVQRRVVPDVGELHAETQVVGEVEPRRDVRVVVELRHDDLVPGPQLPAERARERERQCRRVRAEDDLVRRAPEEAGGREPRVRGERVGGAARREPAARVGVRVAQVPADRVDHLVRDLGPAGAVEEREGLPQGREARADGLDVERGRSHAPTLPCCA
jgi:hypothetical protein